MPQIAAHHQPKSPRLRQLKWITLALGLACALTVSAGLTDFSSKLLNAVSRKWGTPAYQRLLAWQEVVQEQKPKAENQWTSSNNSATLNTLKITNAFFNRIPYYSDQTHWGTEDYWATPIEMLGSNGGDCEDYAAGKYFSLRELGAPVGQLRMVYVRALRRNEAHMVLAWYPTPEAEPLILDNLIGDIKPASQRTDLEPVYSFNDDDIWTGNTQRKGSASQIRFWRELKEKMAREQAM
ncbi:transglutaminase-like cysteine peptidase [Chitinibacter sp. FCG-7]|uniref:Transglutaminase-like cysteine peptidase n=1 Tax=Chitinibacter mangrovi TaxID=3153927 RepID=A0AAU7F7B4_9NEIS